MQSPQDIYHLIAGKTLKLLKLTIAILSLDGEQIFINIWKSFEYPSQWSKLPNPISHIESFMMSDCLRLTIVMPFILNRSLINNNCFKSSELVKFKNQSSLHSNQVINAIIKYWSIVAKCFRLVFKLSLTNNDYIELEKSLKIERQILTMVTEVYINI